MIQVVGILIGAAVAPGNLSGAILYWCMQAYICTSVLVLINACAVAHHGLHSKIVGHKLKDPAGVGARASRPGETLRVLRRGSRNRV